MKDHFGKKTNGLITIAKEKIYTVSGHHFVFHRNHCPFARKYQYDGFDEPHKYANDCPPEFKEFVGEYFFMRSFGCQSPINLERGYPALYSPGFKTPKEALEAAEKFEELLKNRDSEAISMRRLLEYLKDDDWE